jgi:16S rRNA (cytidine1402-2'-O)-methyltransferase
MEYAAGHRDTGLEPKPTLYVVATPIGNLRDIGLRALDVLKSVEIIAAEDTRITARLLNHYEIHSRLTALHEHNEQRVAGRLVEVLERGGSVAVVSDAGTPAISDPGARVVAAARAAGHPVVPVPGANAAIAALSASGWDAPHFLFYGFLGSRSAQRRSELGSLARLPFVLVFYEAPHRVLASVADMADVLGASRRILVARELTKRFETLYESTLGAVGPWLEGDSNQVKGELVLLVAGAEMSGERAAEEAQHVLDVLLDELPLKQAVKLATRLTSANKNDLYARALKMRGERDV